jgi:hypothetical protein
MSDKLILEGVLQKFEQKSGGRIYPSNIFEKEVSELLNSGGKVSATRGCVTVLGGDLYAKFGSTEEELINSYEMFLDYPDMLIIFEAYRRIINLKTKAIKKKYA